MTTGSSPVARDDEIAATIVDLCTTRGPHKSVCPSEVARSLATDETAWRALMPDIRRIAARLADQGRIEVTQRGAVMDPRSARGAIRLRLNPAAPRP